MDSGRMGSLAPAKHNTCARGPAKAGRYVRRAQASPCATLTRTLKRALYVTRLLEHSQQSRYRIVVPAVHALLQRNDRVVSDVNVLRTHFRAAFRDVAVADAVFVLQGGYAVRHVERMHLERRHIHEEPR